MPIYSYKCPCGNKFDELVPMEDRELCPCPTCGVTAKQILTPVRIDYLAMGVDPAFPTAGQKWEEAHRQQKAKEETSMGEHGDYGAAPGA